LDIKSNAILKDKKSYKPCHIHFHVKTAETMKAPAAPDKNAQQQKKHHTLQPIRRTWNRQSYNFPAFPLWQSHSSLVSFHLLPHNLLLRITLVRIWITNPCRAPVPLQHHHGLSWLSNWTVMHSLI
jgi:hypothetical protein